VTSNPPQAGPLLAEHKVPALSQAQKHLTAKRSGVFLFKILMQHFCF